MKSRNGQRCKSCGHVIAKPRPLGRIVKQYASGRTLAELGEEYGVSGPRISQLLDRAERLMKKERGVTSGRPARSARMRERLIKLLSLPKRTA